MTYASFWHGAPLSFLEHLCLKSFVLNKRPIALYSYGGNVENVPIGVVQRDAADIVPLNDQMKALLGSDPAIFSDYFRVKMMASVTATWVDSDVFFLKEFPTDDVILAYGPGGEVWNGVLRLPPNHPVLLDYLSYFESKPITRDDGWDHSRLSAKLQRFLAGPDYAHGPVRFPHLPSRRTFYGPDLLTLVCTKHNGYTIWPQHAFFPFGAPRIRQDLLNDGTSPSALPRNYPKSFALHLQTSTTRRLLLQSGKFVAPPTSSLLHSLCVENGVDPLRFPMTAQ